MPEFVARGWNTVQIINQLKINIGPGLYRRQTMLDDIREFTGMRKNRGALKQLGGAKMPDRAMMTEIDLRRPYKYRVIGKATYMDIETAQPITKNISWYDDTLRPKDNWIAQYDFQRQQADYRSDWQLLDFEWIDVQHNQGMGY